MRALKITAEVGLDHHLVLDLPKSILPGPAEVIVLVRDEPSTSAKPPLSDVMKRILARPGTKTTQEVLRQVEVERESWGG